MTNGCVNGNLLVESFEAPKVKIIWRRLKVSEEERRPLRIRACPTKETEEQLLRIEVESSEDLEKLAQRLDTHILECRTGEDMVIDVKDKLLFNKKKE
ncbi:hypothetical protein M1O14_01985 [Dehalococcoidia bacterium]|nr:hypothetical protein [Dehalococcoidia bacterium]MCL0056328.1 hypothetical protein [Dehalococcoidia bacterium]MCL0056337.1 hypothetical protein [Dehalococcoidia bacterium]MCL0082485.1 hypothetical protein [Dehalococcoidia bacterium]